MTSPTNRTDEVRKVIEEIEEQIAFDLEVALSSGAVAPENYVRDNRAALNQIISKRVASAITSAVEAEREKVKKAAKFLFDNGYIDKKEYTLEDVEEAIAAIRQTPTKEGV